jgi:quinol monooxygenase YgiN
MFVLSVDIRIKPESVEAFTRKAIENAADSRKEPGCKQQQTAHFKKYVAEAVPLLASRERHNWKRVAP